MRVSSVFNRFFNGSGTPAEPIGHEGTELTDQDLSMVASLTMALTEATEKFARNELADAYKIDGTRWNLTGIQAFVRSSSPQAVIELKRKPSRVFKNMALRVVKASQPYSKMFVLDEPNFYGMTVEAAPESIEADWINVLGTYGKNDTISFAFAFLGDYADPDISSVGKAPAYMGAGATDMNLGGASLGRGATPMFGDALLSLQSAHFWPKGVPFPYEQMALVELHKLPVIVGRAPVTNLNQTLPWGVQDGFVALYGSPYISQQHLRFNLNAQGKLCVTDLSSHGTWLNGLRLPKLEEVELPARGQLSLVQGPASKQAPTTGVVLSFGQDGVMPNAPDKEVVNTEPAQAAASAPVFEPANGLWPAQFTRKPSPTESNRKEPVVDFGAVVSPDLIAACLPVSMHSQPTDMGLGSVPTNMTDDDAYGAPLPASALAVLRVRRADGQETTHPITSLPFEIGREAQGDIPGTCSRVSRVHLRIEGLHGRHAMQVSNAGYASMGTYTAGRREDARFIAPLVASQDKSGWLTLGGAQLNANTVQVRMEAVA